MRILSLGAGVQSTTLALMAAAGEIEAPDCAIFADTGWEPRAVYEHLDRLTKALPFPVHRVSAGNLRDDILAVANGVWLTRGGRPQPPLHILNPDGSKGFIGRQCTRDYKIAPIKSAVKKLLGFAGRRVPDGVRAVQMIGISTDEASRMKPSDVEWIEHEWPLIDLKMSRTDCRAWLSRAGWSAPKSSCIGCPFHSDEQWRSLEPDEFASAVQVERALQAGHHYFSLVGKPFLHASLKPLDQVDFSTWAERGQADLFQNECEGMCGV